MNTEIRTFIAARLNDSAREKIYSLQKDLKKDFKDVRWVNKESLHLTLKFLGNINVESVEEISEILDKTLDDFSNLNISLTDIGVFPDERRPRVLWVGLDGDIHLLGEIEKELNNNLLSLGFSGSKKHFTPHITIARFKKKKLSSNISEPIDKFGSNIKANFIIDEIVLYQSILEKGGARYLPLYKKKLKK